MQINDLAGNDDKNSTVSRGRRLARSLSPQYFDKLLNILLALCIVVIVLEFVLTMV